MKTTDVCNHGEMVKSLLYIATVFLDSGILTIVKIAENTGIPLRQRHIKPSFFTIRLIFN